MKFLAHLRTINRHRRLVRKYCFRLGLIWQGLTHDLSKYSPAEFWRSVHYYQGYRSPNDAERQATGLSLSWLHHKGRNRHHFEYWIDYCIAPDGHVFMGGCKMPKKYDASAYDYYQRSKGHVLIHPETSRLIDEWLLLLKERGEDEAFRLIREDLKKSKTY